MTYLDLETLAFGDTHNLLARDGATEECIQWVEDEEHLEEIIESLNLSGWDAENLRIDFHYL